MIKMRFSYEVVGTNAGKVWEALNKIGEASATKLEKETDLKKDDIYMALGWLMKEGNVGVKKSGRGFNFFLV